MRVVGLVLFLVVGQLASVYPSEDCTCWSWDKLLLSRVCGTNGKGLWKLFPNVCELKKYNCMARKFGVEVYLPHINELDCPPCDETCLIKKFPRWSVPRQREDCQRHCPLGLPAVCGWNSYGRKNTFPSDCVYEKYNCEQYIYGLPVLPNMKYGECR